MASNEPRLVYWDSSIFIAHQSANNQHHNAARDLWLGLESGNINIATSVVTLAEALTIRSEDESKKAHAKAFFQGLIHYGCPVKVLGVSAPIALEAHFLSDRAYENRGKPLGAIDAIHLATAKLVKASALHTSESRSEKNRRTYKLPHASAEDDALVDFKVCFPNEDKYFDGTLPL